MAETVKEAVQTETKQDKPKTEQKTAPKEDTRPREAKKAPLVSAVPDNTATKSILPPVGTKKTEAPEAKKDISQVRVISRPEQGARIIERAERPNRSDRNENRGDRNSRNDRAPRADNRNDRNRGERRQGDDRPRNANAPQRRDNPRFQGMDKDKDAPQQTARPKQNKSPSFKMNDAFMPQIENEQSRKNAIKIAALSNSAKRKQAIISAAAVTMPMRSCWTTKKRYATATVPKRAKTNSRRCSLRHSP